MAESRFSVACRQWSGSRGQCSPRRTIARVLAPVPLPGFSDARPVPFVSDSPSTSWVRSPVMHGHEVDDPPSTAIIVICCSVSSLEREVCRPRVRITSVPPLEDSEIEMASMRFNHMELSFLEGTLTPEFRQEVDGFYCEVLGWASLDTDVVGQSCHLLRPDDGQFILMAESSKPMSSPGYDHLGLLMDTRGEVDSMLAECQRFQAKDQRLHLKEYEDLVGPTVTVHAFYVKYLLPIWFDIQCMEWPSGREPARQWQYS
jgi:hypothetical protein